MWCWGRILRVPGTTRRSNQSILKISPKYSLEGLMLKLKLKYFCHLMWRADSFEKTLMLGKIEGRRRRGWQRMRWLDGIMDSVEMSLSNSRSWWWTGRPGILQPMGSQRVGYDWATELKLIGSDGMIFIFWMLNFKKAFWLSSFTFIRGSLVPLQLLPYKWYRLHIWSSKYFSWQSWFCLVSHPAWHIT